MATRQVLRAAVQAARFLGCPLRDAWALGTGVDVDPYTALAYLSRERFGELFRDAQKGKS